MISKERLVFDTANASEGDVVASFLKGADGTLISHTTVSGKEALDVNVANAIAVDLDAATDSVQAWAFDGTGNAIGSTSGALNVSLTNASIAVTATNLDIRDLAFATDKVDVGGSVVALDSATLAALESITVQNGSGGAAVNIQDGGNSITVDGTVAVSSVSGTVAVTQSTSPWVVSATDLDIRDLAFASDKVDASGSSVTVNDAALAVTSLVSTQKDVSSVTGALLASQSAGRKYLMAQNLGSRSIYVGASGVSIASGLRLSPGSSIELRLGAALSLHAVTDSGTQDVRLLEMA